MNDSQPGQLIVPHEPEQPATPPAGQPEPERPSEQPDAAPPAPSPAPEPVSVTEPTPASSPVVAPEVSQAPVLSAEPAPVWRTDGGDPAPSYNQASAMPLEDISWTATESMDHSKGFTWYAVLLLTGIVLIGGIYLITKDKITAATIAVVLLVFGLYAGRRPHAQDYTLSVQGIRIGARAYGLHEFKAFSMAREGANTAVVLMPLKRFMPSLTVYVSPDLEERVVQFLSSTMPFEAHRTDALESFMRRIHF